jgi:hypothetical protein
MLPSTLTFDAALPRLVNAYHKALYNADVVADPLPEQSVALASIWWPLIVSTNFDDILRKAADAHVSNPDWRTRWGIREGCFPDILGRSHADCRAVLSALDATADSIIWAVQGHLGKDDDTASRLASEVVLGHEEYRRVTHVEHHFRRAFAEVFRRRSLLFVGSGISEPYLVGLFEEILELYGPNPHPHFAFVREADLKMTPDALRSRLNIFPILVKEYEEIPELIRKLEAGIQDNSTQSMSWGFSVFSSAGTEPPSGGTDLEILNSYLPSPSAGVCVALSAGVEFVGGQLVPYFSRGMRELALAAGMIRGLSDGSGTAAEPLNDHRSLFLGARRRSDGSPLIVAVSAWRDPRNRDLSLVGGATRDALDYAAGAEAHTLVMPLIAAGESKHFSARAVLSEMIRAFANWRRSPANVSLKLKICVLDFDALFEIRSGRLDVAELLTTEDVRFWVEVADADDVRHQREMFFAGGSTRIDDVSAALDAGGAQWARSLSPRAVSGNGGLVPDGVTLENSGVTPGVTLRHSRA